ncbi:hypothetical protein Cva_01435 [Caedimonas varicaedens]|uniref:Uncharacterized protein n=1 Tax=Caedimonas varicaedens TaxID=1629334 RepID=A0A0K8ME59_9PROT|nr:hypothetical protein Cva_01435 [Caedimonas varicaedens]
MQKLFLTFFIFFSLFFTNGYSMEKTEDLDESQLFLNKMLPIMCMLQCKGKNKVDDEEHASEHRASLKLQIENELKEGRSIVGNDRIEKDKLIIQQPIWINLDSSGKYSLLLSQVKIRSLLELLN